MKSVNDKRGHFSVLFCFFFQVGCVMRRLGTMKWLPPRSCSLTSQWAAAGLTLRFTVSCLNTPPLEGVTGPPWRKSVCPLRRTAQAITWAACTCQMLMPTGRGWQCTYHRGQCMNTVFVYSVECTICMVTVFKMYLYDNSILA